MVYLLMFLFVFAWVLWAAGDGYSDGTFKRLGTEKHWTKWLMRSGWVLTLSSGMEFVYATHKIPNVWMIVIACFFSFKPLFDWGWSKGNHQKGLYIGETSWTDQFIRVTGIYWVEKNTRVPLLTILYFCTMVGMGFLMLHAFNSVL